jgi:hypothetical protein
MELRLRHEDTSDEKQSIFSAGVCDIRCRPVDVSNLDASKDEGVFKDVYLSDDYIVDNEWDGNGLDDGNVVPVLVQDPPVPFSGPF